MRVRETFPDRVLDEADAGRPRRPHAGGAPAAAPGGQGLPAGSRSSAALANFFRAREPGRAPGARAPRGRRGRRGAAASDDPRPDRRAAARRSASSRSSRRRRGRSGSCGAPGARPSGSAPSIDVLWVRRPGQNLSEAEREALADLRRLGVVLGAHFLEEESRRLRRDGARGRADRGTTYVFIGTPDSRGVEEVAARLARHAARPRAARDRHPHRRRSGQAGQGHGCRPDRLSASSLNASARRVSPATTRMSPSWTTVSGVA